MKTRFILAVLAYVLPSFIIAYLWHLVVFRDHYEALAIYRAVDGPGLPRRSINLTE